MTLKSYDFDLENMFLELRQSLTCFSAFIYFTWQNMNLKTMCEKLKARKD